MWPKYLWSSSFVQSEIDQPTILLLSTNFNLINRLSEYSIFKYSQLRTAANELYCFEFSQTKSRSWSNISISLTVRWCSFFNRKFNNDETWKINFINSQPNPEYIISIMKKDSSLVFLKYRIFFKKEFGLNTLKKKGTFWSFQFKLFNNFGRGSEYPPIPKLNKFGYFFWASFNNITPQILYFLLNSPALTGW